MDLKELRAKRKKAIEDARALVNAADAEKRSMSDDEQRQYDAFFKEAQTLGDRIKIEEDLREQERRTEETRAQSEEENRGNGGDNSETEESRELMESFRGFLRSGIVSGDGAEAFRALSAGVNTEGGYLVTPEQFVAQLIQEIDDMLFIRQRATVYPLMTAASLGVPTLDSDPSDADWTTELATGNEDNAMRFGKRAMTPHPMAKRIKVSKQLLRTSALPVEAIVRARLAYKFAVTQEKAYMIGNGDKRPLGIFFASSAGIPTSRDISEGNTATEVSFDGLISAKYALKQQYWGRADWVFHREVVKEIAKLKDGEGQYIWRESVREGEPDRLLGRPVMMSEYAPAVMTANQYVGALGDFSNYWIVDSLQFQLQRLDELYAESNQTGFIGRYEGDGAPVLPEAFARVQLGS